MTVEMQTLRSISQIVFDLDDTLLDTSRILIPRAAREACQAMIEMGLNADLDSAFSAFQDRRSSRQDLFTNLTETFGVREGVKAEDVANAGHTAFYNRNVETDISLVLGALETLHYLRDVGYHLHLVTQGHRPTQEQKIRILGVGSLFESISFVDPVQGERKRDAFAKIGRDSGLSPESHLSVGNRIDTDISEAKELGWRTCWVRYGEYSNLEPMAPNEMPDHTIDKLSSLRTACRL